MDAKVIEAPKLRLIEVLDTIVTQSAINAACDAIITDVKEACKASKRLGSKLEEAYRMGWTNVLTRSWVTKGEFEGTYVGFGLGKQWLGLEYFEGRIVETLRERFKDASTQSKILDGEPFESMTGPVDNHTEYYRTPDGIFTLVHTYTWFVKRRVEKED